MSLHNDLARAIGNPGYVHCTTCHRDQSVNASRALAKGWPTCCGQTMTIDSHADRCVPGGRLTGCDGCGPDWRKGLHRPTCVSGNKADKEAGR